VASDETRGVLRWKGCQYQKPDAYTVDVESTNMTVDQLVPRHRFTIHRFRILGRDAATDSAPAETE
jgi:hypothetical protein